MLCILIDLLCARFDEIGEKKRAVRYTVDILQSLSLPFYPMFVNIVKQQHGDMAEVVLEELLHQGSSFKDSLLDICLIRLQTSVKDKHTVTMETLDSIFEVFLKYLLCSTWQFVSIQFIFRVTMFLFEFNFNFLSFDMSHLDTDFSCWLNPP